MTQRTKEMVENLEAEQLDQEVVEFRAQFDDRSLLDEIVLDGARKMLQVSH